MPEKTTVVGITENHPELGGPPNDPPSHTVNIPYWDRLNKGVDPVGDEDNTSKRYFLEKTSPYLEDVVTRVAVDDEEDDDDE